MLHEMAHRTPHGDIRERALSLLDEFADAALVGWSSHALAGLERGLRDADQELMRRVTFAKPRCRITRRLEELREQTSLGFSH